MNTQANIPQIPSITETLGGTEKQRVKVTLGAFGDGKYSPAMKEVYKDSQRLLGFSKIQAHVTARQLGVDAGQLNAGKVKIAYGKSINKDGFRTLREITQAMKIRNTWAMSIGYILSELDVLRKQGLECVENSLNKDMLQFVTDAASRVEVIGEDSNE